MRILSTIAVVAMTAICPSTSVVGFVCPQKTRTKLLIPSGRIQHSLEQSASNNNNADNQQKDPVETFMEKASLKGAEKVRAMSIEERTKRAMLAEAVEDRIFSMYDEIEARLQGGVPTTDEDRNQIKNLAKEIKFKQSQYENLVSGKPSAMLGAINSLGSNIDEPRSLNNNTKDDTDQ